MKAYKVGEIWHYRFMHCGQVVRKSTKQRNYKIACDMMSTHKSNLAKGTVGIFEKEPAPTLAKFAREFLVWAASEFHSKKKTLMYYENSIGRLMEYPPLMSLPMDDKRILERLVGYKAKRQAGGLQVSTINHELRCVRRLLRLAVEWGRIESAPNIRLLNGERHCERVVSLEEQSRYLLCAPPLVKDFATILADCGARPEEIMRLKWEYVSWDRGRHGSFLISHGKTKAARRTLPMSKRVRHILETRWQLQGQPESGWTWPAPTASGHIEASSLKKGHSKALRDSKVRHFTMYALRHSFLTMLGASGKVDVWRLAQIAGHSSIAMSMRYVHPQGDAVLDAMDVLSGHEFGQGQKTENEEKQLTA